MTTEQERFFNLGIARDDATRECERAMRAWPTFSTAHHGYAVILEEMDELKQHVWTNQRKRDIVAMRKEAVQLAAMCLRFIVDICDDDEGARR